jgi:hypothetical protein
VSFAQAILYRGAGFDVVWGQFVAVAAIGALFMSRPNRPKKNVRCDHRIAQRQQWLESLRRTAGLSSVIRIFLLAAPAKPGSDRT